MVIVAWVMGKNLVFVSGPPQEKLLRALSLPSDVGFTLHESAVTGDLAPRNVLVSET